MKRRFVGLLMVLPLPALIAVIAPTCERGRGGPGYGEVLNNILAGLFILSIPLMLVGLSVLFGKAPPPERRVASTRNHRGALGLFVLVAACSRKDAPAPVATTLDAGVHVEAKKEAGATLHAVAPPPAPPPRLTHEEVEATKSYEVALARGRAATQKKDYAGALEAFTRALELRPGDARAYAERGYARLLGGDTLAAADDLDNAHARSADPKLLSQVWFNTGLLRERKNDTEGARAAFALAAALSPSAASRAKLAGKSACAADVRMFDGMLEAPQVMGAPDILDRCKGANRTLYECGPPSPDEATAYAISYAMFFFDTELAVPRIGGDFFVFHTGMAGSWPARCTYAPLPEAIVLGDFVEVKTDFSGESALIDDDVPIIENGLVTCVDATGYVRHEYYDRKTGRPLLSIYRVKIKPMPTLTRAGHIVTLAREGCDGARFDLDALAKDDRAHPHGDAPDASR